MFDTKQGGFVMIWSAANRPQKKFGAQKSFVCMKISISRRIAVQIWNQRRQEDAARARALKATTEAAARRRDVGLHDPVVALFRGAGVAEPSVIAARTIS